MADLTRKSFLDTIESNVMCFDGAMGTMLMRSGMKPGSCPETADPDSIKSIHRSYVEAGAQFVTTNTFGGTGIKLRNFGLADKVIEINARNARLAREAAPGLEYYVAGDIGPTGEFIEPFGSMTFEQFRETFSEQVRGLLEGGVDLFIIETMMSLDEIKAAVKSIKDITDKPLIACMTFDTGLQGFRTMTGVDVQTAADALKNAGADVIGANCSLAPGDMAELVAEFNAATELPIIAQPNAGKPKLVNGETVYNIGSHLDEKILSIIESGARIVGGCCGTTPEYITTIRRVVDAFNAK